MGARCRGEVYAICLENAHWRLYRLKRGGGGKKGAAQRARMEADLQVRALQQAYARDQNPHLR